jgi:hypothetical protein
VRWNVGRVGGRLEANMAAYPEQISWVPTDDERAHASVFVRPSARLAETSTGQSEPVYEEGAR